MIVIVCQLCLQLLLMQVPRIPANGSFSEVFNVFQNPARLASVKHVAAGVYAERRFMLREIGVHALALGMPVAGGVAGLKLWQMGYRLYREHLAGLSYALPLEKRLKVAVGLNYRDGGLGGEAGVDWQLTPQFNMGLHLYHPGANDAAGMVTLGYQASDQVRMEAALRKEVLMPLSVRVTCAYRPVKYLVLLGGWATQPVFQFAGVGYGGRNWRIGMTGSFHSTLGITPGISLVWEKE
ncbi:hypothetical protein ACFOTA_21935 [Chitinophaga sp. GCM10012297]|uniref:Type IX secretion system PorP/SprF family membrane protein n=1 Tax=Chitinophaga chungangae TaxID=2821488 RepID=A0ABS3YJM2_9BACT|nr:hypothetical protein [Chitinophaga chungangae]MBO9154891.1 hypothetical protein [Chitinophaga chungangae]